MLDKAKAEEIFQKIKKFASVPEVETIFASSTASTTLAAAEREPMVKILLSVSISA